MLSRLTAVLALIFTVAAVGISAGPHPPVAVVASPHRADLPQHPAAPQPQPQPLKEPEVEAFFERCSPALGPGWIKYRDACYRYFETAQYWEPAERECKDKYNGHLVSVADQAENGFLGKLTYCRDAWIGRFAVHADKTNEAANYRWTDATTGQFHAHNFSKAQLHHPLISSSGLQWWNNVYHAKHNYVCKVKTEHRNYNCSCPSGWKQLNGYCYHMPHFDATYIEGDFYCRGENAHLTSVHSEAELRALSLLNVEQYGCPEETWIGLVKLNPCRKDYARGSDVCYRWSDRSGDHTGPDALPKWQPGHPNNDRVTNCVILKDREIKTVPCYTRARFVCKKAVGL